MGCRRQCEEYRKDEATATPSCSKWNRTLPRPKIGRTCVEAFDTTFQSTCVAMCRGREADTGMIYETCADKRQDMPKPIVGNACNDGVKGGYEAAVSLFSDAAAEARDRAQAEAERVSREEAEATAAAEAAAAAEVHDTEPAEATVEETETVEGGQDQAQEEDQPPAASSSEEQPEVVEAAAAETPSEGLRGSSEAVEPAAPAAPAAPVEDRRVLATLPVTVDESDIDLVIYEGEKPVDAVTSFCMKNMASAGGACMDQLLPYVQRLLADKGVDTSL